MRNVVIHRSIGLGDTLFALSAATALKQEQDCSIWFSGPPQRKRWADACLAISTDVYPEDSERVDLDCVDVASLESRAALMAEMLGVQSYQGALLDFDIPRVAGLGDAVVLTPAGGAGVQTRSLDSRQVTRITEGLLALGKLVVLFSAQGVWSCERLESGWHPFPDFDEYDAIQVGLSCGSCIGVDQGITHLMALTGKPTVIAFTHVLPEARSKFYPPTAVSIAPLGVPCSPCGDFSGRPQCYGSRGYAACAKAISAEALLDAYKQLTSD